MQYDGDKVAIRQILTVGQGCKALMQVHKCMNCKRHHQTDKNHRFLNYASAVKKKRRRLQTQLKCTFHDSDFLDLG